MTNQNLPQLHPSLVDFVNASITGREPNVASIIADAVGAERDRGVAELEERLSSLRDQAVAHLDSENAALRKRLEQVTRVDIELETEHIDTKLKLVELSKELANYRTDTKMLLELGERHVQNENEMTQKLIAQRAEIAALRKALEDRRTVEGWCGSCKGQFDYSFFSLSLRLRWSEWGMKVFGGTPDEAFSAAAEWVMGQL